ncbi:MAG TPA: hypothetical protein VFZ61_24815, partial [Polyangiales bacterium]
MRSIWLQAGLGLGLSLSCVGAARAQQDPAAPEPQEPSEASEAPPTLLSVPMPGKKGEEQNGNG